MDLSLIVRSVRELLDAAIAWLPRLALAILVICISWLFARVRTFDRRRIVVPDADMFTKAVTVNTAFPKRRVGYDLKLPPGSDIFALKPQLVALLAGDVDGVEKDPDAEVLVLERVYTVIHATLPAPAAPRVS